MVGQWLIPLCKFVFRVPSDMSGLITGRSPTSLVLSWVVKYKIKESLTIRKSLRSLFPYTVFVPMLLDLQHDEIQSGSEIQQAAKQTSSVHYLWLECAQYKNSESQTVQMQSESQSLWFCLLGFDPFDLFCLMSLVSRLQHVRGRFFFFTCSVNKEKEKYSRFLYFKQPHITPPTVHLIGDLRADQERKPQETGSSSVNSLQFRQIHFCF